MIHLEQADGRAVITIDRPERRNALDGATLAHLDEAVADCASSRVVVITGAGGHFCAGADLADVEDPAFAGRVRSVLDSIRSLACPVIAAVEGFALGAGTQLAVAADLRVATADASFGIPAARLGLLVDHWTLRRLADTFGQSMARSMLLAADTVSGEEAHAVGAVRRLGGLDVALEWADMIQKLAPLSQAGAKEGFNLMDTVPASDAYERAFDRAWASSDLVEGKAAFAERRSPDFTGE